MIRQTFRLSPQAAAASLYGRRAAPPLSQVGQTLVHLYILILLFLPIFFWPLAVYCSKTFQKKNIYEKITQIQQQIL